MSDRLRVGSSAVFSRYTMVAEGSTTCWTTLACATCERSSGRQVELRDHHVELEAYLADVGPPASGVVCGVSQYTIVTEEPISFWTTLSGASLEHEA